MPVYGWTLVRLAAWIRWDCGHSVSPMYGDRYSSTAHRYFAFSCRARLLVAQIFRRLVARAFCTRRRIAASSNGWRAVGHAQQASMLGTHVRAENSRLDKVSYVCPCAWPEDAVDRTLDPSEQMEHTTHQQV